MYYVYHIHTPEMGLAEGYVGVSNNPKARWAKHKSGTSDSSPRLIRAIKKHNPSFSILACFDTLEEALWQEYTLRPLERMGWNLSVGGGKPPTYSGEKHPCYGREVSEETRKKQSEARSGRFGGHKHPLSKPVNIYNAETHELVAENVVVKPWAKENGYHQAHLSATAAGTKRGHKGVYARYVEKETYRRDAKVSTEG
jgi:predicted GIY-YIG superfamily endonuclease